MKLNISVFNLIAVSSVTAAMVVGCSTPTIPITMDVAGEVKLTGVNKIAIADFNSLPGDPFTGVVSADAETCALVKRAVASSFYASPMYQIADIDVEKMIFDADGALAKKRYDAIMYGRLWWNITPETDGKYPHKFTLESWQNVPYTRKNVITGKPERAIAHVTTQRKDVIEMLDYRVRNATLMLSLSIYRLNGDGKLTKIVDTYQVTDQGFLLMNGEMRVGAATVGVKDDDAASRLQGKGAGVPKKSSDNRRVDANGKIILTQKTVAMPAELQAKLILAVSISKNLASKLAPSKRTFNVAVDLGDDRLENLLKNGAFGSAKDYALYMIRQKMGKQNSDKLSAYLPVLKEPCAYPIPESEEKLEEFKGDSIDELLSDEKVAEYFADEKLDPYFYALGICCEAANNMSDAEDYYRFAFNVKPTLDYAKGIARIYLAMGESKRLKETKKAKSKK